jgi:hypothetical protein
MIGTSPIQQPGTWSALKLLKRGLNLTLTDISEVQLNIFESKAMARLALRMDYLMFKCLDQFSDLPSAIGRRLKRILSGVSAQSRQEMALNEATMGVLAEYHATRGIDDLELVSELRQIGFHVVWPKRRAGSRYRLPRKLVEWTGEKTEFELLLRKPD